MLGLAVEAAVGAHDAQLGRLAYDALKWHASKLAPKVYGDKTEVIVGGPNGGPAQVERMVVPTNDPIEAARIYQKFIRGGNADLGDASIAAKPEPLRSMGQSLPERYHCQRRVEPRLTSTPVDPKRGHREIIRARSQADQQQRNEDNSEARLANNPGQFAPGQKSRLEISPYDEIPISPTPCIAKLCQPLLYAQRINIEANRLRRGWASVNVGG
jgi:hypothetical protein